MTGRSLLAESLAREESLRHSLERALALADVMARSTSAPVREAAASIRTVIAHAPVPETHEGKTGA